MRIKRKWAKGEMSRTIVIYCIRTMTALLAWAVLMTTLAAVLGWMVDLTPVLTFAGAFFGGELTAVVQPIPTRADINEALSVFFQTCALACISSVPVHSVTLLRENGSVVKMECFYHEQEQEAAA